MRSNHRADGVGYGPAAPSQADMRAAPPNRVTQKSCFDKRVHQQNEKHVPLIGVYCHPTQAYSIGSMSGGNVCGKLEARYAKFNRKCSQERSNNASGILADAK